MTEVALPTETGLTFFEAAGIRVTENSLTFTDPHVSWEAVENVARLIGVIRKASDFWVVDLLNGAEHLFGEEYAQLEVVLGIKHQTVLNIMYIGRKVSKSVRVEGPTFSHHAAVAALEPADQKRWLLEARDRDLSVARLRSEITAERNGSPNILDEVPICECCGRPL